MVIKKIIFFLFIFIGCAGNTKFTMQPNTFYAGSIKEGYQILKIYNRSLIKIDTIKQTRTYIFYYKNNK
jgi:hypothetical protein